MPVFFRDASSESSAGGRIVFKGPENASTFQCTVLDICILFKNKTAYFSAVLFLSLIHI